MNVCVTASVPVTVNGSRIDGGIHDHLFTDPDTGSALPSTAQELKAAYPHIDSGALSSWDNGDSGILLAHIITTFPDRDPTYLTIYAPIEALCQSVIYKEIREKHLTDPDYANNWCEGVIVMSARYAQRKENPDRQFASWTLCNFLVANPDATAFVLTGGILGHDPFASELEVGVKLLVLHNEKMTAH